MIIPVFIGTLIPLLFMIGMLRKEHRTLMLFFTWGLFAFMLSKAVNEFIINNSGTSFDKFVSQIAPVVEEMLKMLPLVWFLFKRKTEKRYMIVFYAMAGGIGFSIIENYLYLFEYSTNNGGAISYMVVRSASTSLMHGMTTALIGIGLSFIQEFEIFVLPISFGLFSLAVTGHSIFNLAASSNYRAIAIAAPLVIYFLSLPVINQLYKEKGEKL
jgi:RsiW-degrading membrane proteinase PrsW (M82 family)